jgi:hypothetical protein
VRAGSSAAEAGPAADAAANLCPTGQDFRGTCANGRRMAEEGVPKGTGADLWMDNRQAA